MNIAGKISSAQFRDVVLASWRLGRMERDLRAADMVREIKRRLLAELQANAMQANAACDPADGGEMQDNGSGADRETAVRASDAARTRPAAARDANRASAEPAASRPVPPLAAGDPAPGRRIR